ncbi:hypothetical protein R1flu_006649 [Riccia fluitans]|uniref:Uncharacterized protein n=1 Tax=Riccia fluitans TaxID=41844 RepID=A0ABD1YXG2_9MARC
MSSSGGLQVANPQLNVTLPARPSNALYDPLLTLSQQNEIVYQWPTSTQRHLVHAELSRFQSNGIVEPTQFGITDTGEVTSPRIEYPQVKVAPTRTYLLRIIGSPADAILDSTPKFTMVPLLSLLSTK